MLIWGRNECVIVFFMFFIDVFFLCFFYKCVIDVLRFVIEYIYYKYGMYLFFVY